MFEPEIQMLLDCGAITLEKAMRFQARRNEIEKLTAQARESRLWEWGQQPLDQEV